MTTEPTNSRDTPSKHLELISTGIFTENKRSARKLREKLAADAVAKFQTSQSDRFRQERQWYLNMAFTFGQHYARFRDDFVSQRFDMYVPVAPYWRVRPVINQVRKAVRKEISRLTAQKPNAYVVPSSTSDRDVFAAQAGELIWDSMWRQLRLDKKVRQAVFWQTVCGNGFLKQYWDPWKLDKLNNMYGDIALRAESPFHIFVPDLKEEELEDQPFMIHAQVKNKDWMKNVLGLDISGQKYDVVDDSLYSVLGINHQSRKDTAIILEFWVKPGYLEELPEGGMFTVANSEVIQGWEGMPYSHGEYPFSKLDAIPSGKFYNASIIEDLIPLQRELNRTRGQIIEAKNRMAKPQLAAEEGSLDPAKITSEPGQVVLYKPGMQGPTPIPMQNLPNYVTEEVNRIYTDMADLSGQHEVSEGRTPPGVTAAVAISYLQEQDESMISTHFDSIEEGLEKTGRQILSYVKDYWDEPRTIRLVGTGNAFDVQAFKGSDLRDNTDLRVEGGSALPTSRAAKQAFITDMMNMGFIPPEKGLEVLEIGGLNQIYEQIQVDKRQAQRENLKMSVLKEQDLVKFREAWEQSSDSKKIDPTTGKKLAPPLPVPVNTYDNHPVHIEEHNRYRKSQQFELATPLVKMIFEEHVKQHHEAMMVGQAGQIPPEMANPLQGEEGQVNPQMQQGQPEPTQQPPLEGL